MTESEWLACTDPKPMLEFVRMKASDRKVRFYFCGGCHYIDHLFFRPESLTAVEVAERFADGNATQVELDRAEWDAESPTFGYEFEKEGFTDSSSYKMAVVPRLVEMGALPESALSGGEWQVDETVKRRLLAAAVLAEFCASPSPREADWGTRHLSQVDWPCRWLFDCVFGNPFRPVVLDPAWIAWDDGAARRIAQDIYEERGFDRLPILADALEDAGCTNPDILTHCRSAGPHVRGCWVLDLILGKE